MPSVLFVCTANQCRSVYAEHLLRARLATLDADWDVSSAGTHARTDTGAQPNVVKVLAQRDIVVDSAWRSRPATASLLDAADLILTATHEHLRELLHRNPRVARRAFVLTQFTRLVRVDGRSSDEHATDPAALLLMAARGRLLIQPRPKEQDDIADPIGAPMATYELCADTIDKELASITERISDVDRIHSSTGSR